MNAKGRKQEVSLFCANGVKLFELFNSTNNTLLVNCVSKYEKLEAGLQLNNLNGFKFSGAHVCVCVFVWCNTVAVYPGSHPTSWYPSVPSSATAACGSGSEVHWHAVSRTRPVVGMFALQECACAYECGLNWANATVCISGFALNSRMIWTHRVWAIGR